MYFKKILKIRKENPLKSVKRELKSFITINGGYNMLTNIIAISRMVVVITICSVAENRKRGNFPLHLPHIIKVYHTKYFEFISYFRFIEINFSHWIRGSYLFQISSQINAIKLAIHPHQIIVGIVGKSESSTILFWKLT